MDHYQRLMVDRNASVPHIKKAYYKQAKLHHSDKIKNFTAAKRAESEAHMRKCNDAIEVLSDESKRRRYDDCGMCTLCGACLLAEALEASAKRAEEKAVVQAEEANSYEAGTASRAAEAGVIEHIYIYAQGYERFYLCVRCHVLTHHYYSC